MPYKISELSYESEPCDCRVFGEPVVPVWNVREDKNEYPQPCLACRHPPLTKKQQQIINGVVLDFKKKVNK